MTIYTTQPSISSRRPRGPRRTSSLIKPARRMTMKLTIKQRLRNWLLNDDDEQLAYASDIEEPANHLESEGMRFNLFKASGGFVIETRTYDSRNDRHLNKMYVIHEGDDVGEQLGKIITMESLR